MDILTPSNLVHGLFWTFLIFVWNVCKTCYVWKHVIYVKHTIYVKHVLCVRHVIPKQTDKFAINPCWGEQMCKICLYCEIVLAAQHGLIYHVCYIGGHGLSSFMFGDLGYTLWLLVSSSF